MKLITLSPINDCFVYLLYTEQWVKNVFPESYVLKI
jgi:hypothetical protein